MRMPPSILAFLTLGWAAQAVLPAHAQMKPTASPSPAFVQAGPNEFAFDTGVLRGKLRAEGRSRGLSSVVHLPTGMRLDSSLGLCGHYRVFTAGKRYGTAAWDWPSEAKLGANGSVEVRWPAAGDRPFELSAAYRWSAPDTLDVETRAQANTNLARFESFLASYFAAEFTNALVWAGEAGAKGQFVVAEKSYGAWLAFPRDDAAVAVIRDGRWQLEPNPVDWVVMPRLARPLGVRRAPATGLTAALMSPPGDCFAICTPQQGDPHYSMYLSLFGRDLQAGEIARARVRLRIAPNLSEAGLVKEYGEYAKEGDIRR